MGCIQSVMIMMLMLITMTKVAVRPISYDHDDNDDDDDNDGSSKQAPPFCLAVHAPPAAQTCSCSNNKTFCLAKLYKF